VRKQVSAWTGTGWAPIGAKRFFFDGWKLIGQLDEVKGIRLSFVWGRDLSGSAQGAGGVGGLVALIVHNGSVAGTYFYGYDGNGDVAVLINAADGTEAARYEYAPFGELLRLSGPIANVNPIRFSTKYQDDETGLIYYGHRYLSNLTGRWLSRDPSEEAAGGHNLYALLANDAVDKVDFLGLWDEEGHNFFLDYWLVNRKTPPDKTYNLYKWRCFYLPVFSLLKEGNDIVDGTGYPGHGFWQAQSTANAYQHAMRVPRQPVWEAQSLYLQFLRNSITEAQLHVRNARFLFDSDRERAKTEMEQAIIAIGKGQHALADSTSPVHRGFQVWFGPDTFGLSAAEALPQVVESGLPGWIGLGFAADAYALYLQWHHSHETINIARQYKGETRAKIENVFGSTLDEILRE
jgi:RHS repeat-associated protein